MPIQWIDGVSSFLDETHEEMHRRIKAIGEINPDIAEALIWYDKTLQALSWAAVTLREMEDEQREEVSERTAKTMKDDGADEDIADEVTYAIRRNGPAYNDRAAKPWTASTPVGGATAAPAAQSPGTVNSCTLAPDLKKVKERLDLFESLLRGIDRRVVRLAERIAPVEALSRTCALSLRLVKDSVRGMSRDLDSFKWPVLTDPAATDGEAEDWPDDEEE